MKKLNDSVLIALTVSILFCGCASTTRVDVATDRVVTKSLGYADFTEAAEDIINNMISSGSLDKPGGGRYVMALERVRNQTTQTFDTDLLTAKIRSALIKSGKVAMTAAISGTGARDDLVAGIGGQNMVSPELSLSGKIIERKVRISKGVERSETYFQLAINDLKTGLTFWEDEKLIVKQGSRGASW